MKKNLFSLCIITLLAFEASSVKAQTWSAISSNTNGQVRALSVYGTNLFAGGDFTNIGGSVGIKRIARWNGTAWSALASPNGVNGPVTSFTVWGSMLYLGGGFSYASGTLSPN